MENFPICLLLDVFPAHTTERVRTTAENFNIELLYIPAGATGIYQPLDKRIFGELKSRARCEQHRVTTIKGVRELSFDESITILEHCWAAITENSIKKAWIIDK